MYLPVPLFGYLCDRYSPPPLSLLASFLFGSGYLLAAFAYKSGPPPDASHGGSGWPFGIMVLAFIGIGSGTSCMYLSSVATCAKNYSRSKYRGFMLAVPIAAFGLSGMWQSQIGAQLLYERLPNGGKGNVDVFRYFIFLAGTLFGVGLLGALGLRIVDEEELIDRGVEELEQSGLLEESDFFHPQNSHGRSYGTLDSDTTTENGPDDDHDEEMNLSESLILKKQAEEERLRFKKSWLLNHATRAFLTDRTMWLLAAGFFLLTGPGEAYINNLGTIIPSLTPPHWRSSTSNPPAGRPSTHVSIIAITSTFARLFTGTLSDLFAPTTSHSTSSSGQITFSRLSLLLPSAILLLLSLVNLAAPMLTPTNPTLFPLSSALLGLGYGASFSLVPIIISVVWGVENFATNWGVVAMMPAGGAAVWSVVYSIGYEHASPGTDECIGAQCFSGWAWGCAASVGVAIVLWGFAWRLWRRRGVVI